MSRDFQAWVTKESQIRRLKSGFGTWRIGQFRKRGWYLAGRWAGEVALELASKVERGERGGHGGPTATAALRTHEATC